ncbi:MAG TPA: cation transporter [Acidimicrobiales bacterium]
MLSYTQQGYSKEGARMVIKTYDVKGMSCEHCVSAVRTEITRIPSVTGVEVDLGSGKVTVTADGPITDDAVAAAVDEAGYEVVS